MIKSGGQRGHARFAEQSRPPAYNDETEADVVVVNTCAFISDAKEESINTIIEMGELKKTGKLKNLSLRDVCPRDTRTR